MSSGTCKRRDDLVTSRLIVRIRFGVISRDELYLLTPIRIQLQIPLLVAGVYSIYFFITHCCRDENSRRFLVHAREKLAHCPAVSGIFERARKTWRKRNFFIWPRQEIYNYDKHLAILACANLRVVVVVVSGEGMRVCARATTTTFYCAKYRRYLNCIV